MKIPKEIGSKYRFIVLAGLRVAQLQKGAVPRVDLGKNSKQTTIAIRELLENKVSFHEMGKQNTMESEAIPPESASPSEA